MTRCSCIAVCCLLLAANSARAQWSVQRLNALELAASGFSVSELSGVTHRGQSDFVAMSDQDGVVIEFSANINATSLVSATATGALTLQDTSLDTEGIAFHPAAPGSAYVAYEQDTASSQVIPGIRQYDLTTGQRIQSVSLPSVWTTDGNTRVNFGYESLTRSPSGTVMWTANEEALTIDGNRATDTQGTTVRLQRLGITGSVVTADSQFAYVVDPAHGPNPDRSGLVDLVVLPDGNLLTLERSAAVTLPIFENRIYQVDFTNATDISDPAYDNGLIGTSYTPASKTLLWSGAADGGFGANLEGVALGDQLAAGSWSLVGVADNGGGTTGNLIVGFLLSAPAVSGDFDLDGNLDCQDIDALVGEIIAGTNAASFDLTGDGLVDGADQTEWLSAAALANGLSSPYRSGDANLDGFVDVGDFNIWNGNKFSAAPGWCAGDFNHDGVVDVSDFGIWNGNKFTASDTRLPAVPEPPSAWLAAGLLAALGWLRRVTSAQVASGTP